MRGARVQEKNVPVYEGLKVCTFESGKKFIAVWGSHRLVCWNEAIYETNIQY